MASPSPREYRTTGDIWYLTATGQKAKGQIADRFGWGGQTYFVIATGTRWDTDFLVREEHAVAHRPEDPIGFQSPDDDLSAEIGDIVLPR